MATKHTITLTVVSDIPGITEREIVEAITIDVNARGILIESISMDD